MCQTFNYLKDLTNEQLKACLLDDMESLRDGGGRGGRLSRQVAVSIK